MSAKQLKKVWGAPALLGSITLFGLLSALLGTGFWYVLSWLTMLAPLGIVVWKVWGAGVASKYKQN